MTAIRLAFCGASGTGKTTLARWVEKEFGLPFNPVGSRSVAKSMGFDNPYDVDIPTEDHPDGRRAEFQRRLVVDKRAWEDDHESFVVDRTTVDNLVYTIFHKVSSIDVTLMNLIVAGMGRYTHIVFCPVHVFCNLGDDPNRVGGSDENADMTYHHLFDLTIKAMLDRLKSSGTKVTSLYSGDLEERQDWVGRHIRGIEPMQE